VQIASISIPHLPAVGAALDGGRFIGVTTTKDGTHAAVVLLPDTPDKRLTWADATAWAQAVGGQLPTRPVAALLYANAKDAHERAWHWTADELHADTGDADDASYAWGCYFGSGTQYSYRKSYEGRARAVRLIPLTA
jgi:hypothetical protein